MSAGGQVHGGCAHESGPHEHVDVASRVALARRRSATTAAVAGAVAAVLLVAAGLTRSPWTAVAVAATGWLAASAAGSATLHLWGRRHRAAPVVVWAAIATATVTTAVAASLARVWGPGAWLAGAAGWAAAAALLQSLSWRRLLLAPGEGGEFAREQAVHARPDGAPARRVAWWALPAGAFGLWVWLIGSLPVTLLLVAPAAIALQFVLARRALGGTR